MKQPCAIKTKINIYITSVRVGCNNFDYHSPYVHIVKVKNINFNNSQLTYIKKALREIRLKNIVNLHKTVHKTNNVASKRILTFSNLYPT